MLKKVLRTAACAIVGWLGGWVLGAVAGIVLGFLLLFVDTRGRIPGTIAGCILIGALTGALVGWLALVLISGTRSRRMAASGIGAALGALVGAIAGTSDRGTMNLVSEPLNMFGAPMVMGYISMRAGAAVGLFAGAFLGWVGYEWRRRHDEKSTQARSEFLRKRS